jgi:hypothetical protein
MSYLGNAHYIAFNRELDAIITGSDSELSGQSMPQGLGPAYGRPLCKPIDDSHNPYLNHQWQPFRVSQRRWRNFDRDRHVMIVQY